MIKVTNAAGAAGHNTLNVYDVLGRKTAMCDPNMGTLSSLTSCSTTTSGAWVYTYSKAGDLLTQKDAKNQTLTFTYDDLGRPLTKKQGTTSLVTWTYDDLAVPYSKGKVTQIVDQATTTKFAYDQLGRTTQTQRLLLGVWKTMAQQYDALSRITSETFPDSEQVTYTYNEAGWLSTAPGYINGITYNARGQKTALTYANNLTTTWTHHATNFRVTNRTTSSNQQNLTYGYDNNGNVTSITDSLFTASRSFGYDDLNRMTTGNGTYGINQATQNCSYTYNAIGNLTNKCGAVLSYNDANHPSAVTNHSTLNKNYSYDQNGNMLTRGSNQTLVWDIDNRVSSISITGGGSTSMEYDYSGMRVKKNAPSGTTLYPFAGYEIDPNGTITKFIRVGGESIASKKGTSKYFYHNDHLGSVNVVTDIAGTRVQLNEYDPWGAVSRAEGATAGSQPTVDLDHRFTGQRLDPETGLYYYGGRYYDAEIGRFISADPFVQTPYDPQNLNRYSYVINNPQNYIDPDGYFHQPKKKKFPFWKKLFGYILGPIAQAGFRNGIAGAALELIKEVVTASSGPYFGWLASAIFSGIQEEMFGTRGFGRGFANGIWSTPWSYGGGDGGGGGPGGEGPGNDYPGSGNFPSVPTAGDKEGPPVRFPPWPDLVSPFNIPGFPPRVIYRAGRPSPSNLKPRPGEEYLSFRDSLSNPIPKGERPVFRPGDEYFAVDVSKLPPGSVFNPGDVPGHIGVRNVAPDVLQKAVFDRGRLPR